MNLSDRTYSRFSLVHEMMQTPGVVRNFKPETVEPYLGLARAPRVLLTGEGSSRIFPAKNVIYAALRHNYGDMLAAEGATQALEYDLSDTAVFVASNSGRTKEGVALIRDLKRRGHTKLCGIVANAGTPIEQESDLHYLLTCGPETAVAATKSVVEQALFYDLLFRKANGAPLPDLDRLADGIEEALGTAVSEELLSRLTKTPTLFWAGRNNGVAEELTLKSNEITRKRSDFLEGTYAAHGIEEVMNASDAVLVVDPFSSEEEKFEEVLSKGVGLSLFAFADRETRFSTVRIPSYPEFAPYIQLAAGWNVLVEIGVRLGINLDKAERARKVGNEFTG